MQELTCNHNFAAIAACLWLSQVFQQPDKCRRIAESANIGSFRPHTTYRHPPLERGSLAGAVCCNAGDTALQIR